MNHFNMQNITPEQQRTNEELQYIASYGQQAFNERKLIELSAKEKARLRDEFAIEMAGKLLMKLSFSGSFPDVNYSHEMLMKQAYQLADAALRVREVKP